MRSFVYLLCNKKRDMTEKLYLHPMSRDRFIPKSEYFALLNSKLYDSWLDTLNKKIIANNN